MEHKFELTWGPTWYEWFMTNPGDAETVPPPPPAAATAPATSPIQPKKMLPPARHARTSSGGKGCSGIQERTKASVAAVAPNRIEVQPAAVH